MDTKYSLLNHIKDVVLLRIRRILPVQDSVDIDQVILRLTSRFYFQDMPPGSFGPRDLRHGYFEEGVLSLKALHEFLERCGFGPAKNVKLFFLLCFVHDVVMVILVDGY